MSKSLNVIIIILLVTGYWLLVTGPIASAQIDCSAGPKDCTQCGVSCPCGPAGSVCPQSCEYCTPSTNAPIVFNNPATATSTYAILKKVADFMAIIGIPLAVIFLIYSGIRLLLSRGNEEKVQAAKRTFTWSVVGVVIIMGVYVIIRTIRTFWETKGFQ